MSSVRLSAIIVAFDRPEYLREAIGSVLAQELFVDEIIVIDDCSPSPLEPVVREISSRARYERLSQRSGANVARNRGIELARGEFVALLDDDDIWLPKKLLRQMAALGPSADACLCGWRYFDGTSAYVENRETVDSHRLREGNVCGTSGLVARRQVLMATPFDWELRSGQDWDLFVRLSQQRPLAYVPEALFLRRSGHASITTKARAQTPEKLYQAAAAIHKHRAWLGERAYRRRLAAALLKYIGIRRKRHRYVVYALRRAGFTAVLEHFATKLAEYGNPLRLL